MKIGILSQPLGTNYGGLLQAYALQTVLKRMGHDPWIIQRVCIAQRRNFTSQVLRFAKDTVKSLIGRKIYYLMNKTQEAFISQYTQDFVNKYITPRTPLLYTNKQLAKRTKFDAYEAYIVGSDQVWRPFYSPCITNYFLDFARERNVCRLAYAASFGVDYWEFSEQETRACAELAQLFDGISVREDSGIRLCKEKLSMKAVHVLDPTMLLGRADYEYLVNEEREMRGEGNLFYYVLDQTEEKCEIVKMIAAKLKLKDFTEMPSLSISKDNLKKHLTDCVFPPVTKWLRAFMDAEMVVTDSFHGCVFSIIFNKPFWVIGNEDRGLARFHSLLKMYELEKRLITTKTPSSFDFSSSIDWTRVNEIWNEKRKLSMDFLYKHLKNE